MATQAKREKGSIGQSYSALYKTKAFFFFFLMFSIIKQLDTLIFFSVAIMNNQYGL